MARVEERTSAARWALSNASITGLSKTSSNREKRAMRFQAWVDQSCFAGRTSGFPEAWREYRRSLTTITLQHRPIGAIR